MGKTCAAYQSREGAMSRKADVVQEKADGAIGTQYRGDKNEE
jgi:hypothetical protein